MNKKIMKYKFLPVWILLVLSFFIIIYLFIQLSHKDVLMNKQNEVEKTMQAVKKLMILPDEVPTVATITDLEKLKDQIFFKNAKIGDKVLIYVKAQKAILYDSQSNKIIEIAPLVFNSSKTSTSTW